MQDACILNSSKRIPKVITYTERNNLTYKIRIIPCCQQEECSTVFGSGQTITTPLCKSLPFQGKKKKKFWWVLNANHKCHPFTTDCAATHKGSTSYCRTEVVSAGKSNLCVFWRIFCLSLKQITAVKWKIL